MPWYLATGRENQMHRQIGNSHYAPIIDTKWFDKATSRLPAHLKQHRAFLPVLRLACGSNNHAPNQALVLRLLNRQIVEHRHLFHRNF